MFPSNEMSDDEDSIMLSDDETISIGEISVDDYYDEKKCDDNFFKIEKTPKHNVPLESNNGANIELVVTNNETLRPLQSEIILASKNLLEEVPPRVESPVRDIPKVKRTSAIKARVAIIKSNPKRRTKIALEREKRRISIIERGGEPNKRRPKSLRAHGLITSNIFNEIYIRHEEMLNIYNYLTCVPARRTVDEIVTSYTIRKKACWTTLDYFLHSFNGALQPWCLQKIEKIQFQNTKRRYPNTPLSKLYGLPHLVHFIVSLPLLFLKMSVYGLDFENQMCEFTRGLMAFIDEENMHKDVINYQNVMPEEYRMTYPERTRRLLPPRQY